MKKIENEKKFGFSLAEVLITIGVIGVVSAMAIPTLIQNIRERETVAKLQATHSILTQAVRLAEQESGGASGWVSGYTTSQDALSIAEYLKPHLKILQDCGIRDTDQVCIRREYKRRNGGNHDVRYATDTRYYKIILMNGTSVWWKSTDSEERRSGAFIEFFIDTNGEKLPNQWGSDLFVFSYEDETLKPWGAPKSYYPYTTSCLPKTSTGYGCAYYVIQNGNLDYLH